MKSVVAIAAILVAAPLAAQPAATPVAPAAEVAAKFGITTPIEQLLADPAAKAVLEAAIPGISAHPSLDSFKQMSLIEVQPYSAGAITDEIIATVKSSLASVK